MRPKQYGTREKRIVKRFEKLCDYVSNPENPQSVNHWERHDGFVFADYVLSNKQKVRAVIEGFGEAKEFKFLHEKTETCLRKLISISSPVQDLIHKKNDTFSLELYNSEILRSSRGDDGDMGGTTIEEIKERLIKFENIIYPINK